MIFFTFASSALVLVGSITFPSQNTKLLVSTLIMNVFASRVILIGTACLDLHERHDSGRMLLRLS